MYLKEVHTGVYGVTHEYVDVRLYTTHEERSGAAAAAKAPAQEKDLRAWASRMAKSSHDGELSEVAGARRGRPPDTQDDAAFNSVDDGTGNRSIDRCWTTG